MVSAATTRYYRIINELPPSDLVDDLVEVYFAEANWFVGVLEKYYFDQAHTAWLGQSKTGGTPPELQFFPSLLYQVLAVSLQFLSMNSTIARRLDLKDTKSSDQLSESFVNKGAELKEILGQRSPTIISIEYELMRAFWLKNCSRGTESWYKLGGAIRQAINQKTENDEEAVLMALLDRHRTMACMSSPKRSRIMRTL